MNLLKSEQREGVRLIWQVEFIRGNMSTFLLAHTCNTHSRLMHNFHYLYCFFFVVPNVKKLEMESVHQNFQC